MIDPVCLAAGATVSAAAMKDNPTEELNLDENSTDKKKIVDKEIMEGHNNSGELSNGDVKACNTDNVDIDVDIDHAYHNAGTMRYRSKKTGSNNTDLDSIEHLDFDEDDGKKNDPNIDDDIDSVTI
jgi:hypothetical protein